MNAELKETINRAFQKKRPPNWSRLACDCTRPSCEGPLVQKAFQNLSWNAVPVEKLDEFQQCIPLFTPDAYSYYLPAFINRAVDCPHSDLWSYVVWAIPNSESELELFTIEQLEAIVLFIEYASNEDEDNRDGLDEKLQGCRQYLDGLKSSLKRKGKKKKKDLN